MDCPFFRIDKNIGAVYNKLKQHSPNKSANNERKNIEMEEIR